jgi:two-component system, sensor histidine kinase and response regulator
MHMQQDPALAGTTILMLSSADLAGDTARCREVGITRHLMKPITQAELWDAILTALGGAAHTPAALPTVSPLTEPSADRPLHILLAEDNRVNQRIALHTLEKQGHTVVVVGDGQAALTALAQAPFDLVLMDIQMPVLDRASGDGRHPRPGADAGRPCAHHCNDGTCHVRGPRTMPGGRDGWLCD